MLPVVIASIRVVPLLVASAVVAAQSAAQSPARADATTAPAVVGQALSRWQPGWLDIHHIATGRGNSTLVVLPDSTTMLIDAGAAADGIAETAPHPDATRTPGEWIARYIGRHAPTPALDYVLITHFHADHYGQLVASSPASQTGAYRLTGITAVGDALPIGTVIDRGWPDYAYPTPLVDATMVNYRQFLDAQRTRGTIVERFRPGANDQLRQRHAPSSYPDVEIRNIIGNGDAWTGVGNATHALFPPLATIPRVDWPNENMCSLGLRLTFGGFRYFTGGDLPGTADPGFPAWHAVEPAVANAIGATSVHVVNQHGSMGQESEPFLRTLASSVLIVPSWAPSHPAPDVLKRIMNSRLPPTPHLVFATDLRDATRTVIGARASQLAGPTGHVVVRVAPGGSRYWVIVLSNTDERDVVLSVSGALSSRP